MNISAGDEIAGLPAINLREFFRKFTRDTTTATYASHCLGIGVKRAKNLLIQLESEGYLESENTNYGKKKAVHWQLTPKGFGLANASAARPIKRATAERLLSGLLERVEEVNESPDYLYKVVEVILFGSYLDPDRMTLSDLDIAVKLERKEKDFDKYIKMNNAQADKESRSYLSFLAQINWSYNKVWKRLRNKSWGISLHESHDGILKTGIPTKVVFPYKDS